MTKTTDLAEAKRFLETLCGTEGVFVLVAVSGGADSMCLLHLLSSWGRKRNIRVAAAHFNHHLRGESSAGDEDFVKRWCEACGVPLAVGGGDVRAFAAETGKSIEEAARELRYAFLEDQRKADGCDWILTAHHADDNAETQLLNLLRGTGLRGLTGIPAVREAVARPFLRITREELMRYAAENEIPYVQDETNDDPDAAARNLIRLRVMPLLKELNPRAAENMARTAELLLRDEAVLDRLADELLKDVCRMNDGEAYLDAKRCLAAEPAVLCRGVLKVLESLGGHRQDLTARHAEDVCALLCGATGKTLSLPYGLMARREEAALVIAAAAPQPKAVRLDRNETVRFGSWLVRWTEIGPGTALCIPDGAEAAVTVWQRDDRMTLPDSRGGRSFKRLCTERGISPAERDTMPILRVDGAIAAAPVIGVDLKFVPRNDTAAGFIMFEKTEELP